MVINSCMKTIALFARHAICSLDGCNGIMGTLYPDYKFKLFNEKHIINGFFDECEMMIFPGGLGDDASFYRIFADDRNKVVKDYIDNGGKYLGICMGAYWGDKDFFDLLTDARVEQYIKRPGTDTRRPHPKAIDIKWKEHEGKMYFYDGCCITGDESTFEVIARYKGNNDPMAIVQNRVGLIGCHPEADRYWYMSKRNPYMAKHWNHGFNKTLLREFVDYLITK